MAETITLAGRLADITSATVENITDVTVKAPAYNPGPGFELTTTKPAQVSLSGDGAFTLNVVEGVGWLYLDGDGWSDSVRFVAKKGMSRFIEAVLNAGPWPVPGGLVTDSIDRINAARDAALELAAKAGTAYKGVLPKSTDLDDAFGVSWRGRWGVDNSYGGGTGTYKNLPEFAQGNFTVEVTPQGFSTQTYQSFSTGGFWVRSQTAIGKPEWTAWKNIGTDVGTTIPLSTDLNDMWGKDWAGDWSVDNAIRGAVGTYKNLPQFAQGILKVNVSAEGFSTQTYQSFSTGGFWVRSQTAIGKPEWTAWKNIAEVKGDDPAFEHDLRVSRARHRKPPAKVANAAVALVLDHGTNSFGTDFLPLLRELDIPVTLALNSGMYDPQDVRYKYNDQTNWEMIRGWALNDDVEIANHGVTHGNVSDPVQQKWEVEQALKDLEKNLPGVPIDSFVCPAGLTNVNHMLGFMEHAGTRAMYAKHAVLVTATMPRSWPLTGEPRLGMTRWWVETAADIAKCKSEVLAVPAGWGTMVSFHPEVLGWEGKADVEEVKDFLRWLAKQRDEEKITLLTLRDIAFAQPAI